MLIDHPALSPLSPHMRTYVIKGLQELQAVGSVFVASRIEIYAAAVYERVGELDNCLESMRIAISEIAGLAKSATPTSKSYRYHYENYLLRVTGLLDRALRLVGIALGMPTATVDSLHGNARVTEAVKHAHPEVHKALLALHTLVAEKKNVRNEVAHSSAFSSRELGLYSAVEHLEYKGVNKADVQPLMASHFSTEASLLGILTVQAEASLFSLVGKLEPIITTHTTKDA